MFFNYYNFYWAKIIKKQNPYKLKKVSLDYARLTN
jgi:hypothetical protein